MKTVTEQLREAVKTSGQTMYVISKATGINASVLTRFITDGGKIRSDNFDALAAHLGLELRAKSTSKRQNKGR